MEVLGGEFKTLKRCSPLSHGMVQILTKTGMREYGSIQDGRQDNLMAK
jgi:hypothetical protein